MNFGLHTNATISTDHLALRTEYKLWETEFWYFSFLRKIIDTFGGEGVGAHLQVFYQVRSKNMMYIIGLLCLIDGNKDHKDPKINDVPDLSFSLKDSAKMELQKCLRHI